MSFLDIRTVMFSHVVTDVVCTAVLWSLWRQNRNRFAGTSLWVLDFAFQTVAALLILLRGSVPDWMSMAVSNTLVVTGAFLGYAGLVRFVGTTRRHIHNYVLLAAFVAIHLHFEFVQPSLAARNLNSSLVLLTMCAQCAWFALRQRDRGMRRTTQWVGFVFALFCIVIAIRIAVILVRPPTSNDFFRSGAYDTLVLMSYQLLLILLTYALALMVNHRLLLEIRAEEAKFTTVFRSSPYAITLTRPADGRMLDVNPGFESISGYTCAEAVGKTTLDLGLWVSEADRAAVVEDLLRGNRVVGREYQFRRRSGEAITGLFSAEIIRINDQPWMLSSISDITGQRQMEERLRQAQKMETVGRLAGGVAHDFNNMLQVIISYVELSLRKVEAGGALQKYLLEVLKAAQRSADITGQLLAFARRQVVSPKVVDLNDALAHSQQMIHRLIGEDIDLAWRPGRDLWKTKIDPAQLDQILANLAVNARDAIGGVGRLTIETGNVSFDQAYCATHPGFVPGDFLLLAVSDNGRGMDKETLSHLFEPFFTTKGPGEGTGLGLATIYGIVKQNNGYINVYSEPGQGSTFKVYLPRATEAVEGPQAEVAAPRGGTETVLVAEDEGAILELARDSLTELGYTVLTAGSPEDALRRAEEHGDPIHLLITDVVMPQMNGRQLCERLRAKRPGLKCLYMSGYTANVIAHRGVLEEGVSFIAKPFSFSLLAQKVREVLDSPQGSGPPASGS